MFKEVLWSEKVKQHDGKLYPKPFMGTPLGICTQVQHGPHRSHSFFLCPNVSSAETIKQASKMFHSVPGTFMKVYSVPDPSEDSVVLFNCFNNFIR